MITIFYAWLVRKGIVVFRNHTVLISIAVDILLVIAIGIIVNS